MRRVAERLRNKMAYDGQRWVMVKGGHLPGDDTIDLLHDGDRMIELPGGRIATRNIHGTGCTLSAALAALIPQTGDASEAARRAKAYLTEAIRHAGPAGRGQGPWSRTSFPCVVVGPGPKSVQLPSFRTLFPLS